MKNYISINIVSQALLLVRAIAKNACNSKAEVRQLKLPYGVNIESSEAFAVQCEWLVYSGDVLSFSDTGRLIEKRFNGESIDIELVQTPSYSDAGTPEEMITAFVNEFNSNSGTALEFVEAFTPSDHDSGHYRVEFRLGAYSEAVGMAYRYGDATVDIVARKPTIGNGVIRVYMDGATLEQCEQMLWTASPIMDRTATTDDIQTTVDYVDEHKSANGYYYSNLGIVLLGNNDKGYELMIKMEND